MKNRLFQFIRRHRATIFLALLVSLLYGSEHLFILRIAAAEGKIYTPIVLEGNYDEGYYALRAAAAYRGDLLVGDIARPGGENTPAFLPIANPFLMAGLAKVSGGLTAGFIVSDFLFPPLIFFLTYLLAFEFLGGRRLASVFFASLFMIAPRFGIFPASGALPFFDAARDLYFSRFDYPAVTAPFFTAALYLILRSVARRERATPFLAGAAVGVLFYVYFFDWTYVVVGLGLLFLFSIVTRESGFVRRVATIAGIGGLVSVPYWVNMARLSALSSYRDLVERLGVEHGRAFRLAIVWPSYLRAIVFAGLLRATPIGKRRGVFLFSAAFLLGILVLLNIQFVTGFVPNPDHWHRSEFLMLGLALFSISFYIAKRSLSFLPAALLRTSAVCAIALLFLYGFSTEYRVAAQRAPEFFRNEDRAAAYEFLRDHATPLDSLGVLSGRTADEALFYAGVKEFVPNGFHTLAATDEIWDHAITLARILGLSPDAFDEFIRNNTLYLFVDAYRRDTSFGSYFRSVVREVPKDILDEKRAAYRKSFLAPLRFPYRPDYILLTDAEQKSYGLDPRTFLGRFRVVYRGRALTLYTRAP